MLKLPEITILAIDCLHPEKSARVLLNARRLVQFAELVLVTDPKRCPSFHKAIRYVHRPQSDTKQKLGDMDVSVDYERAVLREMTDHFHTPFVLHVEWDSLVCNPNRWTPLYLNYDYIGAPWSPGMPDSAPCPTCHEFNSVGNGGFSLISRRLLDEVARICTGAFYESISDTFIGRISRPWLESRGLRFAPHRVAEEFSCENRIYSGQFGLHGKYTLALNSINIEKLPC